MITDPVERVIAAALDARGVRYVVSKEIYALDFDLPDLGCKIECKQFFSPRIATQLSRHPDVILIQGMTAALAFASLISPPST